jgi:hypothetical protein
VIAREKWFQIAEYGLHTPTMSDSGAMAGFSFDFTYADEFLPYVEVCLRAAKSRAHQLNCRWRTVRLPDAGRRRCIVDGNTRRLDLLGRALELDLPSVCEGVLPGLTPRRARQLGLGFAELYLIGRDVDLGEGVQTLKPRSGTSLYFPLYEVAPESGSSSLRARLRLTEDVITDFGLDRYPASVVLEELHTALEQLLRELLPKVPPRAHWPSLLTNALAEGIVTDSSERWEWVTDHPHTDVALLGELTTRRNSAKHRDYDPEDPWLSEHWECVSLLLERLAARL